MRLLRNHQIRFKKHGHKANVIIPSIKTLIPSTVFWDFENCQFPKDVPSEKFIPAITDALSKYGCFAKEIHGIGHFSQLSQVNLKGLIESGVLMTDVPSKKSGSADMSILTAIARTIHLNKPPYGIVLISGDRDFSSIVNFMHQVGYSIFLVSDLNDPFRLAISDSAAHKIKWSSVLRNFQNIELKVLPNFKSWLKISDMVKCVKRLTGESLSETELLSKLPPMEYFRSQLFKDLSRKNISLQEYLRKKKSKSLREQKLESIFPALQFCIAKFGDNFGSIYDIPPKYVLECGFTDQLHWALIAEYYDLLELERESCKVKIPPKVVSLLKDKEIPTAALCRFLNTVMYSSDSNLEALLIISNIPNPKIGPLKMDQIQFMKQKSERMISDSCFSDRIVARVGRNEVALVLPWLLNEDPIENARAIDQMNFLCQHPELIPLMEYIQNNPSDCLDLKGFQIQNIGLLEECNLGSWHEYYCHASDLIDGIEITESSTKIAPKKFSSHYRRKEAFPCRNTEYVRKKRQPLSVSNRRGIDNSEKTLSNSLRSFLELAILFSENNCESMKSDDILHSLPQIYKEKGFNCWEEYLDKGKELKILDFPDSFDNVLFDTIERNKILDRFRADSSFNNLVSDIKKSMTNEAEAKISQVHRQAVKEIITESKFSKDQQKKILQIEKKEAAKPREEHSEAPKKTDNDPKIDHKIKKFSASNSTENRPAVIVNVSKKYHEATPETQKDAKSISFKATHINDKHMSDKNGIFCEPPISIQNEMKSDKEPEPANNCSTTSSSLIAAELSDLNPDSFITLANIYPSRKGFISLPEISLLLGNIPILFNYKNLEEYLHHAEKIGIIRIYRNRWAKMVSIHMADYVRKEILLRTPLIWIITYFEGKKFQTIKEKELESFFPMIHREYGFKDWNEFVAYCESLKLFTTDKNAEVHSGQYFNFLPKYYFPKTLQVLQFKVLDFFTNLAILSARKKFGWFPITEINFASSSLALEYINIGKSLRIIECSSDGSKIKMNGIYSTRIRKLYLIRMNYYEYSIAKSKCITLKKNTDEEITKSKEIRSDDSDKIISLDATPKDDISNQDPSKQDISRNDSIKQDPSNQDTSKRDPSNQELSKHDPSNQDLSKQDLSSNDSSNQDIARNVSSNQDLLKQDLSSNDPSNQDLSKQDLSSNDSSNQDLSSNDSSKHDIASNDSSNQDLSKQDIARNDSSNQNLLKQDLSSNDSSKHDIASNDSSNQDLSKKDIASNDSIKQETLTDGLCSNASAPDSKESKEKAKSTWGVLTFFQ